MSRARISPLRLVVLGGALSLAVAGCGSPSMPTPPVAAGAPVLPASGERDHLRGHRYCELLVAAQRGLRVGLDVYNTVGLNECPEESWAKVDAVALARDLGATRVVLNGPRFWTMDRIAGQLPDPTARQLGPLAMRKAAHLELPATQVGDREPYADRSIQRNTSYVFEAGKPVFELVDATGRAWVMQSYSIQFEPQTFDSLPALGARLHVPAGWTFRTRTLDADLVVSTVDGVAHVTQDDFQNTYMLVTH